MIQCSSQWQSVTVEPLKCSHSKFRRAYRVVTVAGQKGKLHTLRAPQGVWLFGHCLLWAGAPAVHHVSPSPPWSLLHTAGSRLYLPWHVLHVHITICWGYFPCCVLLFSNFNSDVIYLANPLSLDIYVFLMFF